jgi:Ni,Fe-hydrogenase III small subunit/ferredoxin
VLSPPAHRTDDTRLSARPEELPTVAEVASTCPTSAITLDGARPRLDRGRCVLCGRCVSLRADLFSFEPSFETSTLGRQCLVVPRSGESDEELARLRHELSARVRGLRRSIHIRHVDAGSDGSDEWEVAALANPVYDVQRLGIFFTATPRHADLLLVTGVGSKGMVQALSTTYDAMPYPKIVVASGADAASGGMFADSYAVNGGIESLVPVDIWVPGSPPSPFGLLHGILLALGVLNPRPKPEIRRPTLKRGGHDVR